MNKSVFLTIAFLISFSAISQNRIDSLKRVLLSAKSNKALVYRCLAREWVSINIDSAYEYAQYAEVELGKEKDLPAKAEIYSILGKFYKAKRLNSAALQYFNSSAEIYKSTADKRNLSEIYHLTGITYEQSGDYTKALEIYQNSLKLSTALNDQKSMSKTLNNIGGIFYILGDFEKSLNYYLSSLEINEKIDFEQGIAASFNNIGNLYQSFGYFEEASAYYEKSLEIKKKLNDKQGIANALNNIGGVFYSKGNIEAALIYYERSIGLEKQIGNSIGVSESLENIGTIYFNDLKSIAKARKYFEESLTIAQKINYRPQIRNCNFKLAILYESTGDITKAYKYFKNYLAAKDSLMNIEKVKTIAEIENRAEMEQRRLDYQILVKEKELTDEKLKKQLTFTYSLIVMGVLLILLVVLAYNRYLIKRNANELLIARNKEIQRQQNEILASINYAKNIQNAILPSEVPLKGFFEQHFILYLPKDIVSGDFYWMHTYGDKLILAAVDCTGHGVPGGFLSMLGTALLNDIVHHNVGIAAHEILNLLNENIINLLHQNVDDIRSRDGMDIALCVYDKKQATLQFAGAHNPLYLVRNGQLIVYKADRMPIGIYTIIDKSFSSKTIDVEPGDIAFIFSDGFADQFGGPDVQKYKSNQFKHLLENIAQLPLDKQKVAIQNAFYDWKGENEQVDDILIIGMKF
jgi:serine phosphatase RsbU (regulator of sigma subunit)/tetratricopeptide (TPR) repeat protein